MKKIRWAVVGTSGFALDWLARGISLGRNSELAAIVSRDPVRGKAAAQRTGAPHHFTSIEAIDTTLVDGVFLCTPNTQHEPMTVAAARRGLHVICEKPMAPGVAECERMVAAARDHGVVLAVAHCMEWCSPVVRARELIEQGAIGDVLNARIAFSGNSPPDDGSWRQNDTLDAGGGPLYDLGVHALDTIIRLLGPVERVAAFVERRMYDYAAEDTSTLLLRFRSGAHGVMESHFTCSQNAFEIQGTKGRLWSDNWLGREMAGDLHLQQGATVTDFELPVVNVYVPQIEHISDCVLTGAAPLISGERGLANIAVIRAAVESARSGRVVDV
jgi:1,5-anhydro-D-fructose reductase (1,5-anhydro-D-mannitol-forming)